MSGILYEGRKDPMDETPNLWGGDYKDYPWGHCSECGRRYPDYNKICPKCQNKRLEEFIEKERLKAEEAKKHKPPDIPAFKVDPEGACK